MTSSSPRWMNVRPAPAADHDREDIFEDETGLDRVPHAAAVRGRASRRRPAPHAVPRRLAGSPTQANQPLAARALRLPATGAPGTSYALTAPTGDALAGRIWHRGRHQLALTVDGVGDGLLIALDRAPDARRPNGRSQVILTTFGLSERTFDELAARWRTWWSEHFDNSMPGA